jgi:hypothetical protein
LNQPTLFDARAARDEGIRLSRKKNSEWLVKALHMLRGMKHEHSEVTGEEMRVWLLANGLPAPSTPHAWGMLTRTAMKGGMLLDTGRQKQMWTEKSHARRTPIWRFT